MANKQTQISGNNSQQIQSETVNIINKGIDEKRVREIIDEKTCEIIKAYSEEAYEIAKNRIDQFNEKLIRKIIQKEFLEYLKDPEIQLTIKESQKKSSMSNRETDYEILSELLIDKIENKKNNNSNIAINRAIQIINDISDKDLAALTIYFFLTEFSVSNYGSIFMGIHSLNNLYSSLPYNNLPYDGSWLENLEILNVIKIIPFAVPNEYYDILSQMLNGYIEVGIKKDSHNYNEALNILKSNNFNKNILINHELRDGYVRLPFSNLNSPEYIKKFKKSMTFDELNVIKKIYSLYEVNDTIKKENLNVFINICNSFYTIKKIVEWFDSINKSISINSVGKTLAYTNLKIYCPDILDLNENPF